MNAYAKKLTDPRWQKKRLEIFQRDGFKCAACAASDKTLHVHHRYYVKGREPWDYPDFALVTLCQDCHYSGLDDRTCSLHELDDWEIASDFLYRVEGSPFGAAMAFGHFGAINNASEQEMYDAIMWSLKNRSKEILEAFRSARES